MFLILFLGFSSNIISLILVYSFLAYRFREKKSSSPFKSKKPYFHIYSEIRRREKIENQYFVQGMASYQHLSAMTGCSVSEVQKLLYILLKLNKLEITSVQGTRCYAPSTLQKINKKSKSFLSRV